jgi:chloramphenicol 3-O-phosphotransferase
MAGRGTPIILNGGSSAGKATLAKALAGCDAPGTWLHLSAFAR